MLIYDKLFPGDNHLARALASPQWSKNLKTGAEKPSLYVTVLDGFCG